VPTVVAALAVLVTASASVTASVTRSVAPAAGGSARTVAAGADAVAGARRLVVVAAGPVASAERAARDAGAGIIAVQRALGTVVVSVDPGRARATAARIAASPAVRSVSPDRPLRAMSLGADASGEQGSMALVADTIGARRLWQHGITGAGVGVALLDTGVAPVAGLLGADKVVVGPDLSFESQNPRLRNLDTYGHGTHMAGIIAGREGRRADGPTYAADPRHFYGVAPDATLLSLKLADRYGAVDVSQVVAAIDWVVQHRNDTGVRIRVINLSFGTPSQQAPSQDPLSYAAEVATRYGIVVVAAAGNNGDDGDGLNDPAYNRNVIAVGSTTTSGTVTNSDDRVPSFSARPGGSAWWRRPDVVAPGSSIVSLRVPGSYVAQTFPAAAVGRSGIRGSGTSQSAAVVSGAVALLLQQRPWLAPAQVKWLLRESARPLRDEADGAAGSGSIQVAAAAATLRVGSTDTPRGSGRGSLELARGGVHVSDGAVELTGERDVLGNPWTPRTARRTARADMWTPDGAWNGGDWTGSGLVADDGPAGAWSGRTWSGRTWSGRTWSGRTWSGRTWSDARWDGSGWHAASWPTPQADHEFAAKVWATAAWPRG
jgi:serine protease AprX